MQKSWIVKWILIAVLASVLILLIVFAFYKNGSEINQSGQDYPVLAKDEKLPDIGWSGPWPGLVFEFEEPLPEMPDKMIVYRIVYPDQNNITEAYVRELAEKYFDMPKDALLTRSSPRPGGSALFKLKTQTHLFVFDPDTGFFDIHKYEKARQKRSRDRKDFPSDEECKKIATDYLKGRGLFEDNAYGPSIVDNTSSGVMSVGFGQMVGTYKRSGSAGSMVIDIGPDGEIVTVGKQWLELVSWKLAPIIPAREAFEQLKKGRSILIERIGGKITKIELRYELPGAMGYALPVYWFDYSTPERYSYAVVPAIRPEYRKSQE